MINILFGIISLLILGIVQISFLTTWPLPVSSLNLVLSLVIFLTVMINYQKGLWWALGAGLFLELYSGAMFGITTLSLIMTVLGVNFLFNNFFTNRSLYSLVILGFFGSVIYNLLILSLNFIGVLLKQNVYFLFFDFWSQFFWQPVFNVLVLMVIFFAYYLSTGRLKNLFLFPAN
ncbi:MAG: hypothetical protein WC768_01050 [Patescibacteria group bacterium]|jgi:rod shape-determining protein MreD